MNFKGADYQTSWVELPDITKVRKELQVAPSRLFPDGTDYHTLPAIRNTKTGEVIGDSFEIAVYLDKLYPDKQQLVLPSTLGLLKAFNVQVDTIFSNHAILMAEGMEKLLNPETAELTKQEFGRRHGLMNWNDLKLEGEARVKILSSLEAALKDLALYFRQTRGPFLDGPTASYADLIVGGWIQAFKATVQDWNQIRMWHDSFLDKLDGALAEYVVVR